MCNTHAYVPNNSFVISCIYNKLYKFILQIKLSMSAVVAPSGECLRGEGLLWLIGSVVCSLAAAAGPIVR